MGVVYEVVHIYTDHHYALKLMTVNPNEPGMVARFAREARLSALVGGENVVRIIDADVAADNGNKPFLVMELLRGDDLERLLEREGPRSVDDAEWILRQAAAALAPAHAGGIVHRDLKPSNLFLHTEPGGRRVLKVLDFGLAKLVRDDFGTSQYKAPEQARGEPSAVGPAVDIWALGMIAYELLTGESYWNARTPLGFVALMATADPLVPPSQRATNRTLPPAFDEWFARSCDRSPAARFPTVTAQADAFASVVASMPHVQTPSVAPTTYALDDLRIATPMRGLSKPVVALGGFAAVLLALAVIVGSPLLVLQSRPSPGEAATRVAPATSAPPPPPAIPEAVPVLPLPPPRASATPPCETPFYTDDQGIRRYKPECL